MEIRKAPEEMRIAAMKNIIPWDEVYSMDDIAEREWRIVYDRILQVGGVAYWDSNKSETSGHNILKRYALHQSTKQAGYLQLSVMYILNGKMIPGYDTQHARTETFLQEVPDYAVVVFL